MAFHPGNDGREATVRAKVLEPGIGQQVFPVLVSELQVPRQCGERLVVMSHEGVSAREVVEADGIVGGHPCDDRAGRECLLEPPQRDLGVAEVLLRRHIDRTRFSRCGDLREALQHLPVHRDRLGHQARIRLLRQLGLLGDRRGQVESGPQELVGVLERRPRRRFSLGEEPPGQRLITADLGLLAPADQDSPFGFERVWILGVDRQGAPHVRVGIVEPAAVAASVVSPEYRNKLEPLGVNMLADLRTLGIPWETASVITTAKNMQTKRDMMERVIRSLLQANAFILNPANRARVADTINTQLGLKNPQEAAAIYDDLIKFYVFKKPYPTRDALTNIITEVAKSVPKATGVKYEDVVDISIVERLDKSGFIDALYK